MRKILILTQAVDKSDPVLGFFHRWIEEFARQYEQVTVICLRKGHYELPSHVKILSLGKEEGRGRLMYLLRFYRFIWKERKNYDKVFVHMNQEYVLLGWKMWKLLGKSVFLWRNHAQGSILTRLAVALAHKVFYTSPHSYTARFGNAVKMPVGIDTEFFKPDPLTERIPGSVLFLGRISPVKQVLEFVEWVNLHTEYSYVTVAGPVLSQDRLYYEEVKRMASHKIKFIGPVDQEGALRLYQSHEIYVNMTPAGSFDKTILEAAACAMKIKIGNEDLKFLEEKTPEETRAFVIKNHNLELLVSKIKEELL